MCKNVRHTIADLNRMKNYKQLQNGTDIRGIAIDSAEGSANLTTEVCADLAAAFAVWLSEKRQKNINELSVAIGRDSRLTGPAIAKAVEIRLAALGMTVYSAGLATTPAMFMITHMEPFADAGIMITASHLPFNRNGLKFFTPEGCLEHDDISELIDIAEKYDDPVNICSDESLIYSGAASSGSVQPVDFMSSYAASLRELIIREADHDAQPLTGLHIVIDAGNGAGGFYVKDVLEPLGADCSGSLFLEPDGSFPNHVPNPENAAALQFVCQAVKANSADLGIIFDTDVDRAAAVGSDGNEIARNRIIALSAALLQPCTVVTDSVTSTQLSDFLENRLGCRHFRYRRGYKNVINKGIELNLGGENCLLAIETSGHAALRENYFLDDGSYLAAKIIAKAALLKREGKSIETLIEGMKDPLESVEVRFSICCQDFASYGDRVLEYIKSRVSEQPGWSLVIPNYEGVRVNVPGGWFLLRKSLHDPVLPLNIESDLEGGCDAILSQIKKLLQPFGCLK